jgi:Protein phosphatase 2C
MCGKGMYVWVLLPLLPLPLVPLQFIPSSERKYSWNPFFGLQLVPPIESLKSVRRVNGNLNLSRAIGDLRYKGNQQLKPADQIITAEPDIVQV